MMHEFNENKVTGSNVTGVLVGTLIGGLVGAVTMLLLAPQSGEDTRKLLQQKGIELRDRTGEMVEDTLKQARTNAQKIQMDVKDYAQLKASEQLDSISEGAQAAKKKIEKS